MPVDVRRSPTSLLTIAYTTTCMGLPVRNKSFFEAGFLYYFSLINYLNDILEPGSYQD